jgi:SAM-dependent methyltransferase
MNREAQQWEAFHLDRAAAGHPRWPNEAMVRTVFGRCLREPIALPDQAQVLDVGCGFGNNLLPFLDRGHACCGVEITDAIASLAEQLLRSRGYHATIRQGGNRHIPFDDGRFDLLLSLNVLHYEKEAPAIAAALAEYARVLKDGGAALIITVAPRHDIYVRAEPLGDHRYRIANYDFRDGEQYFYFDDPADLEATLAPLFDRIEIGRVTEQLFTMTFDFFIAVARKRAAPPAAAP